MQGRADAPDHAAEQLRAGGLCVEDATRRKHGEHPAQTHLSGGDVDADFGEARPIGVLRVVLVVRIVLLTDEHPLGLDPVGEAAPDLVREVAGIGARAAGDVGGPENLGLQRFAGAIERDRGVGRTP